MSPHKEKKEEKKVRKFYFMKFSHINSLDTVQDVLNEMEDYKKVVGMSINNYGCFILIEAKK